MTQNVVPIDPTKAGAIMEAVIARGDLAQLDPGERAKYYTRVCESIGLNPLTKPFEYIVLNGKLTLYARKETTDQLRKMYGVSVVDMTEVERDGLMIVTVKVRDNSGRTDMAKGAVMIANLKGEALANALMRAETKAKRRATLSICGLGFLDETEIETVAPTPRKRLPKKDAREAYTRMQAEVDAMADRIQLQQWEAENNERIAILPEDWEDILLLRIQERRLDLARAYAEIAEPTVVTSFDEQPEAGDVVWEEPPADDSKWDALTPTQQAGILCNELAFVAFCQQHAEKHGNSFTAAPEYVRQHCIVKSRADIRNNHASGRLWRELVAEYRAWQREPELIDSASPSPPQAADVAPSVAPPAEPAEGATLSESEQLMRFETQLTEAAEISQNALKAAWSGIPQAWRKNPALIAVKDRLKAQS